MRRRQDWILWAAYGGASLVAILTGCGVVAAGGAAAGPVMNVAAWIAGAALAAGIARMGKGAAPWWSGLAVAGLVLTLFSTGLSGVHRWIGLGPLRLNGAEMLLPLGLTACAGLGAGSILRLVLPPIVAALLAVQPDVSQAVAATGASALLLIGSSRDLHLRILSALAVAAAVVIAGLRPDPLTPVPQVEGVIGLAAALSPLVAALAVAALASSTLAPLLVARSPDTQVRGAAWSLAVYFVLSALAPAAGAFPVPLVGMGVSPVLGSWLGIGWLMNLTRQRADSPA